MKGSQSTTVNVIVPLRIEYDNTAALKEGLNAALDDLYFEVWSSVGYHVKSGKPKKVSQ